MNKSLHRTTQRDFFLYLLVAIALYASVASFIRLLFTYINVLFPDKLDYSYAYGDMTTAISILIVFFPVYLGISWFLKKDLIRNPEKREFFFRKFFVYLTLFVAAMTMMVDCIAVIHIFLKGELTTRFLFKVLVILVVAAAVFGYYFREARRKLTPRSKPSKTLAWIVSLVMAVSIVSGFFVVGNPWTERQLRFDDQRVSDLQYIQNQIIEYWQLKSKLPSSLDDLRDDISGFKPPQDPESGLPYEYKTSGELAFELCTTFHLASREGSGKAFHGPYGYGENWQHPKDSFCFSRTIDSIRYKLRGDSVIKPRSPIPPPILD